MFKHFILAVSVLAFVAHARADVVIGFDAGPTGSLSSYSEDGFTLAPLPGGFISVSNASGNPVPRLDSNKFQIAATNGSTFNLISLDYRVGDGSNDDWRVEGFFAGSGSIVQVITDPLGTWKTASFTGFTGLSSVEITPTVSGGLSWDNIRVAAIPEPSAFAFLGMIGLVAGGRIWWKRRR